MASAPLTLLVSQHWQQFEPQLSLWDVFRASREVKALLAQGLLLLDHRYVVGGGGLVPGGPGSPDYRSTGPGGRRTDEEGPVGAGCFVPLDSED